MVAVEAEEAVAVAVMDAHAAGVVNGVHQGTGVVRLVRASASEYMKAVNDNSS